jgi:hypothetical protein
MLNDLERFLRSRSETEIGRVFDMLAPTGRLGTICRCGIEIELALFLASTMSSPTESDPELELQVRASLSFLFTTHGGKIASAKRLPGIGNSQVFIGVLDLIFRIIQGASMKVLVAPRHSPNEWQAVELLLKASDPNATFPPPPVFGSLNDLGVLLEPRLILLSEALSKPRFEETIKRSRRAGMERLVKLEPMPPRHISVGKRILVGTVSGIARMIWFIVPHLRDSYKKLLPIGSDAELEKAVEREFAFLFEKHGARISSNGRLGIMDFASVSVDVGNLRLCAARDRGYVGVSVSPLHSIRNSHDLGVALIVVQPGTETRDSKPSSILRGAAARLEPNFPKLNEAFSESQFPATNLKLREIETTLRDTWIEDWNKKSHNLRASTIQ